MTVLTVSAHNPTAARPLVIWRLLDGKPGHENQSLGLSNALADLLPVRVYTLSVQGGWRASLDLLSGRCPAAESLPAPDLLIGAGHRTHVAMLACRRARGGRVVVLMRPSLPVRWFDLCIIPEHDGVAASERVLLSRGVLNPLQPGNTKDPAVGLILVGGPSAAYHWDEREVCEHVAAIVARDPRRWALATSRRTPDSTVAALQALTADNLRVVPSADTGPGWLAQQLRAAPVAWVTEDSVSMMYEALTAGAACGVLPVPVRRPGRVRAGLEKLLRERVVTSFQAWSAGQSLVPPAAPFDEAARAARWIVERWFAS